MITKRNEIIIVITYNSEYISMGGIIQCYQKMKKELKLLHLEGLIILNESLDR